MKNKVLCIITTIILVLIDQIAKICMLVTDQAIDTGIFELILVKNTGVAFGFANDKRAIILIINVLLIVFLIFIMKKLKEKAIIVAIAGGISNLMDRITRGFVIDYISINKIIRFPVFNLADVFIIIGLGIAIINIIRQEKNNENI